MQTNRRVYAIAVLTALLGLLLGTCAGAFGGGVLGYWAGRKTACKTTPSYPLTPDVRPEPIVPAPDEAAEGAGARVTRVVEGSPAASAGLRAGDLITVVGGSAINQAGMLEQVIRRLRPGDRTEIVFWRQGQRRATSVRLGTNPDDPNVAYLGVYYAFNPAPGALPSD